MTDGPDGGEDGHDHWGKMRRPARAKWQASGSAGAIAQLSYMRGKPIQAFFVRKKPK